RPRRSDRALALERLRRPAGLARIPQLLEALDVLLAKLAFELPIAQRLADDLACGGVLAGLDGRPKGGDLLAGQGDTDFLNIGHWISGGAAAFTTRTQIIPRAHCQALRSPRRASRAA